MGQVSRGQGVVLPVLFVRRCLRLIPGAALGLLLAACGGGGDSPPAPPAPPPPPAGPPVTISGRITYDFVPHDPGGGLDYGMTEARPARLVAVQYVAGNSAIVATRTDLNGNYSMSVPADRVGFIRVRAESVQTAPGGPVWNFRVVDNTSSNAIYTLDGTAQTSGSTDSTRNLHAISGWLGFGAGYGILRPAAPFAILDTIYEAAVFVAAADPAIAFPPLVIHWSPDNIPSLGTSGLPNPASGEIGTSFYGVSASLGINGMYLLGAEDNDTEEYDRHVIVHEFSHYLEQELGRSDTIGGPHSRRDRLDPRVAFSEGWATGLSALVFGPVYSDSGGTNQLGSFAIDVEGVGFDSFPDGWYSEKSVWELFYDLADTNADGSDNFSYPFADLWSVLTGRVADSTAITTIFTFMNGIRIDHPADEIALNQLLAAQSIDPIVDDYGSGETNNAGSADALPLYTSLTVGGPAVNLCSTNHFGTNALSTTGAINKLASRRFIRFTPPSAGTVTITMTATDIPPNEYADPDFIVHRQGPYAIANSQPTAACVANETGSNNPAACVETATQLPVATGEHILEIYEWTNTNDNDDPEFPPIGRTCFNVTVTQP